MKKTGKPVILEDFFSSNSQQALLEIVTIVVRNALELFQLHRKEEKWQNRPGGAFCCADGITGIPYFISLVMPTLRFVDPPLKPCISFERAKKYLQFAQEKALRLSSHKRHFTSYQSRRVKEDKYGGAVRLISQNFIYSFSGLPEKGDEAVMLVVAVLEGSVGFEWAQAIAKKNKNQYLVPLYNKCSR